MFIDLKCCMSRTCCCGSRYGIGRTSSSFTRLRTAVVAPIASAMVRTAMAVNAGCLSSWREAKRMSLSIRAVIASLLFAQRLNWIDVCCAPRRQKTCSQRRNRDHDERGPKSQRIVRTDLVEQIAHQTRQNQGYDAAENDSCRGQLETARNDEPQKILGAGAESHS